MSIAKKSAKGKPKPKSTKPATRPLHVDGDHKEGSRKGKVHELFNKEGPEVAWVLGLKLKLKEGTLRSSFASWKRVQSKGKGEVKTNSAVMAATTPETLAA
jgi:hypothetical protein